MAARRSRKSRVMIAFGDVHIPHQNPRAVEVVCRAVEHIKPDLTVCLGDLLDCGQFSSHPPTHGVPETNYQDDLAEANALLDRVQNASGRLVMVEGNHEYRLDRWAALTSEGRGAYSMLAPRLQLSRNRKKFTYVPYGSAARLRARSDRPPSALAWIRQAFLRIR